VVQVRPKIVRDLLAYGRAEPRDATGSRPVLDIQIESADTLNKVAQSCERQYFKQLWLVHGGDFAAMAAVLLGDREHARKVQLRFNQLGLKVRDLKGELR
jgi:two-component system nitrogen regulation response regulator GlnG